jgi:hypothetical protein
MQPGRPTPDGSAAPGVDDGPPMASTITLTLSAGQPMLMAVNLAMPLNRTIEATPRMQRLKAITYDRRPSAMLDAWKPKPKDDKKPELPLGAPTPPKKTPEEEKLDKEIETLQRVVSLGEWAAVKEYLNRLTEVEAVAAFGQILRSLSVPPIDPIMQMRMAAGIPVPPQVQEKNVFRTEDVIGLAMLSPRGLTKEHVASLGQVLRQALDSGVVIEHVVERLKEETKKPAHLAILTQRQAAHMLASAGQMASLGDFLPTPEKAFKEKDLEALNLLARHYLDKHANDKKSQYLERAWEATLHILALEGDRGEKEQALRRAVDLAPKIKEELGQAWLDESFTKFPERGMDILATLGSMVARSLQANAQDADTRLKGLQLQKTAVDAMTKVAPAKLDEWQKALSLLAANWLKEADYSRQHDRSTGYGNQMRRDYYGNFYFFNPDDDYINQQQMMMRQQGMPQAIRTPEVLRCAPNDQWLKRTDPGLRPRIAIVLAQLYLKIADEQKAFPYIESLATTHPDQAKALVKEFLTVWTKNHDPNANRNMNRFSWIYFYGFESRAEGIPLTRSKQERNLIDLGQWVIRIRNLKLGDINEDMLARAFTACHSSAEVYKTEAIERVFGAMEKLQPKTLASLAQTMRGNLASIWKDPGEQERKKTKRKQRDIEVEIRRGYDVALATVDNGLGKHKGHWALIGAKAALIHDRITFEQELAKSSDFSETRRKAFQLFQQASDQYRSDLLARKINEDEESTQIYEQWFHASLGAVDLGMVTERHSPDGKQPAAIRQAILALPGDAAKRHMDKFSSNLFTRMSSAKPQVKFNYLRAGFQIVDADHKLAVEARKVYDYYKDLALEIKLDAMVDGPSSLVAGQPFGVFVNLRHTRDIERESGGFGKYLQNQNSMYFSYNYGRPAADYRDRFETATREAFKEHFEVVSVTFQSENVNSRAHKDFGWRITPYAYVLLKPRGPHVDRVPPLRLDLDFLDTSGYVVLPVESPSLAIDCKATKAETRPLRKLKITQTLDERQADKGKLLLEIKAIGVGLVGPLDDLLTVEPKDFDIKKIDDNGANVSKFDEEGKDIAVLSERNWTITLHAKEGLAQLPTKFSFGSAKVPVEEMTYQRYDDADVLTVSQDISLEQRYGKTERAWKVWAIAGGVGLGGVAVAMVALWIARLRKRPTGPTVPETLTPFATIELLQRARGSKKLSEKDRVEIDREMADLEAQFFATEHNGHSVNLRTIAERWIGRME